MKGRHLEIKSFMWTAFENLLGCYSCCYCIAGVVESTM